MTRNGHKNNKISLQIKSNCAFFFENFTFLSLPIYFGSDP